MSWDDLALKFEYGMDSSRMRKHFENDSPNGFVIARLCEVFGLPTPPSEEVNSGAINKVFDKIRIVKGWTRKDLARRMWPGAKGDDLKSRLDEIEGHFERNSRDAFRIARMCEVFALSTLPSEWFLNEEEAKLEKSQLELI